MDDYVEKSDQIQFRVLNASPIKGVRQFLNEIERLYVPSDHIATYRGHADFIYQLKPSVFRTNQRRESEDTNLRELISVHPSEFTSDISTLEMLVRMQHYSMPTRLLDVSHNPLVSLYFACEDKIRDQIIGGRKYKRAVDGEVVVFLTPRRRVKYFDSDTVACLSNLARLRPRQRALLKKMIDEPSSIDYIDPDYAERQDVKMLRKFNSQRVAKRLVHFIRQEKFNFDPEIVPSDLYKIILVKPKRNNRRIIAQAGSFFIFGLNEEMSANERNVIEVMKIRISAKHKRQILNELSKLSINEATLFPEIDRAANYIMSGLASD